MLTGLAKVVGGAMVGAYRGADRLAYAVQVVIKSAKMDWVTKPIIIRNPPITALIPTKRQAAWRYYFAEAASQWRGAKGRDTLKQDSRSGKHKAGDIVLAVQAKAQEVLKDLYKRVEGSLPPRASTYDEKTGTYRSYVRYRIHTKEELKKLAGIA